MIDLKYELDLFPMVMNRSVVNLIPTKIFLDWLNYIRGSDVSLGLNDLNPISLLIKDFDFTIEFDDWLELNYDLLFMIRLNYSCIDKSIWPEIRTFDVFKEWFEIKHSNLILDLEDEPIKLI
jgi:hypothetical protein